MLSHNSINGFYKVDGKIIYNKLNAILEASQKNSHLEFIYFDEIFQNAAYNFKHQCSLKELYRQRAQQLRESYDYLILNYSGGSDSHNILMTFLEYGIKLDHIYVQWPMSLVDKGIYQPNNIDTTNSNFHSEWDLVLKKDLEYISKTYPNIKIEIADWTDTLNEKFYTDDIFSKNVSNLPSIARSQKQNTFSKTESELALKGKNVASIFGVDKPSVVMKEDKWYFYFVDTACMAYPNPDNPCGLEYFYWSPKFPDIVIAQAYSMKNFYLANKDKLHLVTAYSQREKTEPELLKMPYSYHYAEYSKKAEHSKLVCYPYWSFNRFQADKPFAVLEGFKLGMRAWDNILTVIPGFNRIQQSWEYHWKSYLNKINLKLMRSKDTVTPYKTKWHYLP